MKATLLAVLLVMFLVASTAVAQPAELDPRAVAVAQLAGWDVAVKDNTAQPDPTAAELVGNGVRKQLTPTIAHYQFDVRFGPGEYDVFRLHRVVKENRPNRPIRTAKNLFLQHGCCVGFVKFVFGAETPHLPDDFGIAVYLAEAGIDVWGIDQPWVFVPEDETDFSFSADWGTEFSVDRIQEGLAISRAVRFLTGSGFGKMNLLGYSFGGYLGYALLDEETQRPAWARNVAGYICADSFYKFDRSQFEEQRLAVCSFYPVYQSLYDAGVYNGLFEPTFPTIGQLADDHPDDPSPYAPGLTNLQFALVSAADPFPAFSPWFHYWAGVYDDATGLPVDLAYTPLPAALDFFQQGFPFEPLVGSLEQIVVWCDDDDSPFDDHVGEIDVPVLYFGAAGGFGEAGFHTLDLLASTDKTIVNISVEPPLETDFAHIDLFTGEDAPDIAWPFVRNWIRSHSGHGEMISSLESAPAPDGLRVSPNPGRSGDHYRFSFEMPTTGEASAAIYDVTGRRVASLVAARLPAGRQEIVWDARATDGSRIADGVYFARVDTPQGARTARFVHLRQ
jgi:hypothetical protein